MAVGQGAGLPRVLVLTLQVGALLRSTQRSLASDKPNLTCSAWTNTQPSDTNPYVITSYPAKYLPGKPVSVTVTGRVALKGLMLQVMADSGASASGHFTQPSPSASFISCTGTNDTVTGWFDKPRETFVVTWVPASNLTGTVKIRGTFLQDRERYWNGMNIMSKGFSPIDLSSCGQEKGCFRYKAKSRRPCDFHSCDYILTYRIHGENAIFELSARADWAAIGFSSDNAMGGDDIYLCKPSSSHVTVERYYSVSPHETPSIQRYNPARLLEAQRLQDGRKLVSCRFTRPMKAEGKTVDLSNDWHQLYAWGRVTHGGTIARHDLPNPPVSKKVSLYHKQNEISSAPCLQCHVITSCSLLPLWTIWLTLHHVFV